MDYSANLYAGIYLCLAAPSSSWILHEAKAGVNHFHPLLKSPYIFTFGYKDSRAKDKERIYFRREDTKGPIDDNLNFLKTPFTFLTRAWHMTEKRLYNFYVISRSQTFQIDAVSIEHLGHTLFLCKANTST